VAELSSKTFAECLNTRFAVAPYGGEVVPDFAIVLKEVNEQSLSLRLETFSLIFHGPMGPYLLQALFHLEHEKLGRIEMFLVPIGPEGDAMAYEAVFNLFREKAK
jgi:hypothetical protein